MQRRSLADRNRLVRQQETREYHRRGSPVLRHRVWIERDETMDTGHQQLTARRRVTTPVELRERQSLGCSVDMKRLAIAVELRQPATGADPQIPRRPITGLTVLED
jgi:hypothetical protein